METSRCVPLIVASRPRKRRDERAAKVVKCPGVDDVVVQGNDKEDIEHTDPDTYRDMTRDGYSSFNRALSVYIQQNVVSAGYTVS